MNKPTPGKRVLASEHNPAVKAGTLIGHVLSVTGDTFALKLDSGRVIYAPWRSVDGHNSWLVYEDDKTEDPPTQQPAYWTLGWGDYLSGGQAVRPEWWQLYAFAYPIELELFRATMLEF